VSTTYFNRGAGAGSEDSPFFQLKAIPLTNLTNVPRDDSLENVFNPFLPVWRSSAANNFFDFGANFVSCNLKSVDSAGSISTVRSTVFDTILTGSEAVALHLNTTDQCLYVLLYESPSYRLIKIHDTTGVATNIGSSFTPSTAANWPKSFNSNSAYMLVDVDGHIRVYHRGFYHQINKSTGAIVTQNTAVTIGGFSLINTIYLSADNTVAAGRFATEGSSTTNNIVLTSLVSLSTGSLNTIKINPYAVTNERYVGDEIRYLISADSDKLFFGDVRSGESSVPFGYVYRADFDQFLQSVVDWYSGE